MFPVHMEQTEFIWNLCILQYNKIKWFFKMNKTKAFPMCTQRKGEQRSFAAHQRSCSCLQQVEYVSSFHCKRIFLFLSVAKGFCQFFPLQVDFPVPVCSKWILSVLSIASGFSCFYLQQVDFVSYFHCKWIFLFLSIAR